MKEEIDTLFQQQMDRKEFLQFVGSALLLVLGAGSVLKALKIGTKSQLSEKGYGSSSYGGHKKLR